MNTPETITLIICITCVIVAGLQVIYQFILERDNYANKVNRFELEGLKIRVKYLENKFKGVDK